MNGRVQAALDARPSAALRPLLLFEITQQQAPPDERAQKALLDDLSQLRRALNTVTEATASEQADRFRLEHKGALERAPAAAASACIEGAATTTKHTAAGVRALVHKLSRHEGLAEALSVSLEDTLARALGDGEAPEAQTLRGALVVLTDDDLRESWRRLTLDSPAATALALAHELSARELRADVEVARAVAHDPRTSRCERARLLNELEAVQERAQYATVHAGRRGA